MSQAKSNAFCPGCPALQVFRRQRTSLQVMRTLMVETTQIGSLPVLNVRISHSEERLRFLLKILADKKARASLGNPADVDSDGLLADIIVQPVNEEEPPSLEDKRRDTDQFFHPAVLKVVNGKTKKYSTCKLCPYV
jgi:hypothetical protein